MPAPINRLKAALGDGGVLRGVFLSLGSEAATEIAGRAGFDFCLVDGEHCAYDPTVISRQLTVLAATGMPSAVRVPTNEGWIIRQVLDLGAQSIMVPMVNSADEARAIVRASLYPPEGVRGHGGATMRAGGYGAFEAYGETANHQISIMAQIETRRALDAIEEIAAVDGIDVLFFGPTDLSYDMGLADDPNGDALWEAVSDGIRRIVAAGKVAGVFSSPDREAAMIEAGARVVAVGSDAHSLTTAFRRLAARP